MEFVLRDTVEIITLMSQGISICPCIFHSIEVSVMANLSFTLIERQKEDSPEAYLYTVGSNGKVDCN